MLQTPEIANDTAFASNTLRVQNRVQLQELLQQQFKQFSCQDFENEAQLNGIPYGRIRNMREVFEREAAYKNVLTETIEGNETKRLASVAFTIQPNS